MGILLIVAFILIIVLLGKIIIMKKSISSISKMLNEILESDSNMLITSSTTDKTIEEFIRNLNTELKVLKKLKLEFQNGNQDLRRTITNISHDIRTPLTAIRGYVDLMSEEGRSNKKYLSIIENKLFEMEALTEELYDYTFCLDKYREEKCEDVVLNEVLEECIGSFYASFKKNGIIPIVEMPPENVVRRLNKNVLYRAFENIISNSLKYSEGDFRIFLSSDGTTTFSNETSKIDRIVLASIFDRFYTVEGAKKKSGIGLSIAKQLVEMSGGSIEATLKNGNLSIKIKF
ncbi:MAG TPA: sensor histidine kinase [Firmicutes bacterium]|nr:sensor histidine kinase [Bacillota bacterium]